MELIIVAVIALLVLGPKKLPAAGRSLGHGLREFRGAISGNRSDEDDEPVISAPEPRDRAAVEG